MTGLLIGTFVTVSAPLSWTTQRLFLIWGLLVVFLLLRRHVAHIAMAPGVWSGALAMAAGILFAAGVCATMLVREGELARAGLDCESLQPMAIRLQVLGLPRRAMATQTNSSAGSSEVRFDARVIGTDCAPLLGSQVFLSWQDAPQLAPGQELLVAARLRVPGALVNPLGRDSELALRRRGIAATGRVLRLLALREAQPSIDGWRLGLRKRLDALGLANSGSLLALLTGDAALLGEAAWETLRRTGTVHLFVISGLHVSVVAALCAVAISGLAWFLPWRWALPGTVLSLLLLGGYVQIAGAGTAAVRAWCMAGVGLIALRSARAVSPSALLAAAWCGVAFLLPRAPLQPGYWLSFLLVAWLLVVANGERGKQHRSPVGRILAALRLHVWCSLMLAPLLGWLRLPVAPGAILANLVAVPWVTLILVPGVVFALLLLMCAPDVATSVLRLLDLQLHALFVGLEVLRERLPPVAALELTLWRTLVASLCLVGALLPVGRWLRALGLAGAVVLLGSATQPPSPDVGSFHLQVLDVGQGTAVTVRTANHALLYDTAARLPGGYAIAEGVVAPELRNIRGGADVVVISHADNDHVGGLSFLQSSGLVGERYGAGGLPCRLIRWQWDGVAFRGFQAALPGRNNASCVLEVRAAGRVALLAGDIEAAAEGQLLGQLPTGVDLLLIPHHGSKTSSTAAFVDRLAPQIAVVSAGFRNRFGHPHPRVSERYRAAGSRLLTTACSGAVTWRSDYPERFTEQRRQRAQAWLLGAPLLRTVSALAPNRRCQY